MITATVSQTTFSFIFLSVKSISFPYDSFKIKGRKPLTRLGIEIAAVALKLVPNCSALIIIYKTEIPRADPI